jgi:probable phosphoglycerate mutase
LQGAASRYLYLVRHGEALPDESGLTDRGRRQATLLGEYLSSKPISVLWHGPQARAIQTAQLIVQAHGRSGLELCPEAAADDYLPYAPARGEVPEQFADRVSGLLDGYAAEERERGAELAVRALHRFTGPVAGDADRHELVVTHNFLIGWLVRDALDAPAWRWMGVNQANCGLTVIRYAPDRPASVLVFNDLTHLPQELRWTGFPPGSRV